MAVPPPLSLRFSLRPPLCSVPSCLGRALSWPVAGATAGTARSAVLAMCAALLPRGPPSLLAREAVRPPSAVAVLRARRREWAVLRARARALYVRASSPPAATWRCRRGFLARICQWRRA